MQETRHEIMSMLTPHTGLAISTISEGLELHPMTVRQHISILENNGYVAKTRERRERGRPRYLYHLTEQAKAELAPDSYSKFASGLLNSLIEMDGEEKANQLLQRHFKNQIMSRFKKIGEKGLSYKVKSLVNFLNEEGYLIKFEETKEGYTLLQGHRPIGSIQEQHSFIDSSELSFFEDILGTSVERTSWSIGNQQYYSYNIAK